MEWVVVVLGIVIYGSMIWARLLMKGKKLDSKTLKRHKTQIKAQVEKHEKKPFNPNTIKHIMERSCLTKKNLSLEKANQVVDRAAKEGREVYYYSCQFCGSYHMTRKDPTKHTEHQLVVI